ncbi:MAG: 3-isopropylmalate dehydratase small subunit [Bacillota bacterium]|nr:3-isopropylmalate dehydratase small subunit [Bacillota bacterium]
MPRAHVYGDHVDTDVIIPARYLNTAAPAELARHCMEDIDAAFIDRVRPGDIVFAGENFGCGSSREHAPVALRASGVAAVVAASFARIFYRNALNVGLAILECPEAVGRVSPGDEVEVVPASGRIANLTTGESWIAKAFPAFIQGIIEQGGLVPYTQAKLATPDREAGHV